jgi:hypothetical protein
MCSFFFYSFFSQPSAFFSLLFDYNLPFLHYARFVFTVLIDAHKWEMHVNIHNTNLVPANNCTVNNAGEYNEVKNLN